MLWQAVSCSLLCLWCVAFLQTLVLVFQNPPLWCSLTWPLNFPLSQFSFIVWLLCTAEWKENRHQSRWLSVDHRQRVQECADTWWDSWYWDISSRVYIVYARSESSRKPDSSDQHWAAAGDILYMRLPCVAKNVRVHPLRWSETFTLDYFSLFTPSVYWSLWLRVKKGVNGSEHVCTLQCSLLMALRSANDWIRWRWKAGGGGVVILKQVKWTEESWIFYLPFIESLFDGQALTGRWSCQNDMALQRKVMGSSVSRCIRVSR